MDPKIAKSREDEYFAREEFHRLKKLAEERASKLREQELTELKEMHWMRCPKDGMELVEVEYMGVRIDKCSHCGGIYLDAGELDSLFNGNKREEGLMAKILGAFS
jgi:uncharacterized protein